MNKMERLLAANGLDATKTEILETKMENYKDIVYVICDGVKYRIEGLTKTVISDEIKRPRGWHLKAVFVDSDGNVFYRGDEKPELKGTLPQTI